MRGMRRGWVGVILALFVVLVGQVLVAAQEASPVSDEPSVTVPEATTPSISAAAGPMVTINGSAGSPVSVAVNETFAVQFSGFTPNVTAWYDTSIFGCYTTSTSPIEIGTDGTVTITTSIPVAYTFYVWGQTERNGGTLTNCIAIVVGDASGTQTVTPSPTAELPTTPPTSTATATATTVPPTATSTATAVPPTAPSTATVSASSTTTATPPEAEPTATVSPQIAINGNSTSPQLYPLGTELDISLFAFPPNTVAVLYISPGDCSSRPIEEANVGIGPDGTGSWTWTYADDITVAIHATSWDSQQESPCLLVSSIMDAETSTPTTVPPTATATPSPSPTPTVTGTAVIPETGAVIVRVETTDGSDLPDGLKACVDSDCQPLGTLASTQLMAFSLPSGSGVAFFAVPIGPHEVTLRDATGTPIDSQQVTVVQDEATEVTYVLDRQPVPTVTTVQPTVTVPPTAAPTATSMPISSLPNTGQGPGSGSTPPVVLLGMMALALLGTAALRRSRRIR